MKKKILGGLLTISLLSLSACSDSDELKVKEGPYKGYKIVKVIDKYTEENGSKYIIEVETDTGYSRGEVPKEEFDRVEVNEKAYYRFFLVSDIKIPREKIE